MFTAHVEKDIYHPGEVVNILLHVGPPKLLLCVYRSRVSAHACMDRQWAG